MKSIQSQEANTKTTLAIIARYDGGVNYLYPLVNNISHKHRAIKDAMLSAMFEQYRLFHEAAKSNQVSKIYLADAGLAHIKELLRFMADPARKRSVTSAKRKIARYRKSGDKQALGRFVSSWRGHAQWADAHNLLTRLGVTA